MAKSRSAAPPATQAKSNVPAAQGAAPAQPSMLGGIMQTAAGVGIGSVVGSGISNMLFGGRSHDNGEAAAAPAQGQAYNSQQNNGANSCEILAKDFTQCLNATGNDMGACAFYLDQLKACQAAAAPY